MTLQDLITHAAERAGSRKKLAERMQKHQNRLTEWDKGVAKPDAHEIAFMAALAELPVLQTVAEIESQLDSRYADVWRSALGKLTAAGVAASLIGLIVISPDANAAPSPSQAQKGTVYIM